MNEKSFQTQPARSSKDVIDFYDRYASNWDERFGPVRSAQGFNQVRQHVFLRLANLKETDYAVELGVGTGPFVTLVSPLVRELVCIDGSAGMLEKLRSMTLHLPNVKIMRMDLEEPLKESPFQADILFSFGLIDHIVHPDSFVPNCRKMLKKGGRVLFVTANGDCPWYHPSIRRFWRPGKHCSSDKFYKPSELTQLMERHGFIEDKIDFWGYFPGGTGDVGYFLMGLLGKCVDKTPLRRYAGGIAASYILKD